MSRSDRFLKACRMERTDCTPIWLINQNGRYLDAYRTLREEHDFMTMIKTPELAAEVTVAPVNAFDVDAAILFSDIVPFLEGVGMTLEFGNGGLGIVNPIRSHADIESLVMPSIDVFDFTTTAITLATKELDGKVPLIGFAGAPFTLACYAVEGGNSMFFHRVKSLMHSDVEWWHKLMNKFSSCLVEYVSAQVEAGAQAIQLFDSFIGILSPYDFREYVMPHLQRLFNRLRGQCPNVPMIYYGTDCAGILPLMSDLGCSVVSLDWKSDLPDAWNVLGSDMAIQGNLDPALLLSPEAELRRQTARIIDALRGHPGHVMNLGHSVSGNTSPEAVQFLVDFVHEYSAQEAE